mgnify:CR=1 FL=1
MNLIQRKLLKQNLQNFVLRRKYRSTARCLQGPRVPRFGNKYTKNYTQYIQINIVILQMNNI